MQNKNKYNDRGASGMSRSSRPTNTFDPTTNTIEITPAATTISQPENLSTRATVGPTVYGIGDNSGATRLAPHQSQIDSSHCAVLDGSYQNSVASLLGNVVVASDRGLSSCSAIEDEKEEEAKATAKVLTPRRQDSNQTLFVTRGDTGNSSSSSSSSSSTSLSSPRTVGEWNRLQSSESSKEETILWQLSGDILSCDSGAVLADIDIEQHQQQQRQQQQYQKQHNQRQNSIKKIDTTTTTAASSRPNTSIQASKQQQQQHRQQIQQYQRKRLDSTSSQFSYYIKNVAHKCHKNADNFSENLDKMLKQRYVLFLFLVSFLMIACLLATLVISRGVGQLNQEESSSSSRERAAQQVAAPELFEERQLELVDLLECDKTFAYTRWRLQIRVPKSTPSYRQSNRFNSAALESAKSGSEQQQQQAAAVDSTTEPLVAAASSSSSSSSSASLPTSSVDDDEDDIESEESGDEKYFLTSTNEFVSEANGSESPASNEGQSRESRGESMRAKNNHKTTSSSHQDAKIKSQIDIPTTSSDNKNRTTNSSLTSWEVLNGTGDGGANIDDLQAAGAASGSQAAYDLMDPMQFAASEMKLSLFNFAQSVNSSLVDCFIVDTEKRREQKTSVERQHQQVASTRRVEFAKMMSVIQACRNLTWLSLGQQLGIKSAGLGAGSGLTNGRQLGGQNKILVSASSQTTPSILVTKRQTNPLIGINLPITTPINPSSTPAPALIQTTTTTQVIPKSGDNKARANNGAVLSNDPFGNLFSMFMNWNEPVISSTERPNEDKKSSSLSLSTTATPTTTTASSKSPAARVVDTRKLIAQSITDDTDGLISGNNNGNNNNNNNNNDDPAKRASYLNMGMSMISGIVPNTLWCGLGDRASNYSELGAEYQVDSCCRAHDHCPIRLKPFTADYGLINWSMSTRSHCDCDLDFNDCLTQVNTTLSNVIKTLYFRFVGLQCIDIEGNRQQRGQQQSFAQADASNGDAAAASSL